MPKRKYSPKENLKRYFFPTINNEDDVELVLKEGQLGFYGLGGLMMLLGLIGLCFLAKEEIDKVRFFNMTLGGIYYPFFAYFVRKLHSRSLAVVFFFIVLFDSISTFMVKFGIWKGANSGSNIVLAVFVFFISLNMLKSVYKYHELNKSQVIWKNAVIVSLIAAIIYIPIFILLLLAYSYTSFIFNVSKEAYVSILDNGFGMALILSLFLVWIMAMSNKLPFTKNKPVIVSEIN